MKNKILLSLLPLVTDRLILKTTITNDIDLLLKIDKQEEAQKFLGGTKNKTKEQRIDFIKEKEHYSNEGIVSSLTVYLKDENIPIGFISFNINEKLNKAELFYIFDFDYTKKGYCTEVVEELINIGFSTLKIDCIYADIVKENYQSQKLLEKLGFQQIGSKVKNDVEFL